MYMIVLWYNKTLVERTDAAGKGFLGAIVD